MSTYIGNLVHFVWSTAEREPLIHRSWQDDLCGDLGGILRNKRGKLLAVGGMADHVHVFASLPATLSLAQVANALKANSSRWVHENTKQGRGIRWQEGYSAFTVSKSAGPRVRVYIKNQEQHHRGRGYKAELLELLKKHEIEYDERYLWD
jgi:REP element-mobilizing transposase RayT